MSFLGLLGLPALLAGALKIVGTLLEWLTPVMQGIGNAIVEIVKILWAGVKHTLSSWQAIALTAALMFGTGAYYKGVDLIEDRQQAAKVRTLQEEIKRLSARKCGAPRATPGNDYEFNFNGLGKWFK